MQIIPKKFIDHRPRLKKVLLTFIAVALWSFILWRALNVYGPSGIANSVSFNSDCAIPVLMSNDERPITIFNLYYYGTDRWGGWPFLITQGIRRATGYRWSDQSIFIFLTVWLFIGVLAIARLDTRAPLLAALAYLISLCLHTESRLQIFELSQLYAWQVTALLLGWYCLRRFFEDRLDIKGSHARWKQAIWLSLTFWFSFLAIWSSNASIPFLIFLLLVEAARAWSIAFPAEATGQRLLKTYALGLLSILAAIFCEWALKWNYHRHALKHYGQDFKTSFSLDRGFLGENFTQQLHHLTKLSWWPLYLLPTLALLGCGALFIYLYFKKKKELLLKLRTLLRCDTAILAIGAYGIAAINFMLTILINHIRLNYYDDRYMTLTYLFAPTSGILVIFLLCQLLVKKSARFSRLTEPALATIAFLILMIEFPPRGYSPQYKSLKETALALEQKAPREILLGGYWDTYVLAALQEESVMIAVPREGQEVRMPWTRDEVRQAARVIVVYNRIEPRGFIGPPPEHLEQYGARLRLVDPKWYENDWFSFALYVKETQ